MIGLGPTLVAAIAAIAAIAGFALAAGWVSRSPVRHLRAIPASPDAARISGMGAPPAAPKPLSDGRRET